MARRKKRKKLPQEPTGKMQPADGAKGPAGEGTRVDDDARHAFFSFKGELKSELPDATQSDFESEFEEREWEDAEATSAEGPAREEAGAEDAKQTPEAAPPAQAAPPTGATPPAQAPPEERARDDAAPSVEPLRSTGTAPAAAAPEARANVPPRSVDVAPGDGGAQEQTGAGPVRGQGPAAEQTASQSRKAAGPAHFTSGPVSDATTDTDASRGAESTTETELGAAPFAADDAAGPTQTEIDAGLFAPRPEADAEPLARVVKPGETGAPEPSTQTDVRGEPFRPRPKPVALGDESAVCEGTAHEPRPAGETPTRTELGVPAGIEAALGAAAPAEVPARTKPEAEAPTRTECAAPPARTKSGAAALRPPREAGSDAETETKEPTHVPTATIADGIRPAEARRTETDVARPEVEVGRSDAEPRAAAREEAEAGDAPTASLDAPALWAPTPESGRPSLHEAETDSQPGPFDAVAQETARVPPDALVEPGTQTLAATEVKAEIAPFPAAPLFEAPAPPAQEPERPDAPRPRGRRVRREERTGLGRVLAWAKRRLDPRDFFEIAGKALLERATQLGTSFRKARREQRVSHTREWWQRTLVETAILYAIIVPIELAVTQGRLGSFGVHPHPYWLVVLPLAAARGLVAGLIAAAIASILYTIGAAHALRGDILFTFRNMTEPILFFAVAFFAGELHDEAELKRRKLDRRVKDLEERTSQLRQQRDVLMDANRELERRIVDDSVQFGNLIQAARRIERAGRQEVFDLALEMVQDHCGAAASVLMLLDDGSLDYLCHRGWPSEQVGARLAIARRSPFVQRAVSEGVAVNGLDPSQVPPQEGPLVVAPLFDAGGVVKALMCLDEIPLIRLNESTVTVFLGIAEWASAALARLTRGGDAPAPRPQALSVGPEVDLWLGTVAELGKRLRLELARCSRYGVPTSFLTIQATEWADASREGIEALDRFVLMHFTTGLRPSDGLYRFGYAGCYLLVLAGTTLQGAEVVRTRLLRRVSYAPTGNVGQIEIVATGPDAEAPDLASLVNRCAKRFRERSKLPLDARCPVAIPERLEAEDLNAFLRRLKMETSLAVRNGFDLHVVGIAAEASEKAGPGILARHVVEVGAQTLRPTDGVYMIGQYQCSIILPCTNGEEAATVAHRLATLVRARDPSAPYGAIETQVLGLGPSHPDAGSFLTALARRKEGRR